MTTIAEAFVTLRPDTSKFGRETEEGVSRSINSITGSLLGAGAVLTAGVTAPIVGVGTAALRSAMSFESAFTGVVKTVDATAGELDTLRSGILDMSKDLPASAASIADVAMSAGQLGIQVPNILEFSRVMIDLGEATNLSAQDAATQLARLANITGMSQQDFDRLGSSVVALGNNLATTEAEIVEFGLRIAGAGDQVGLSEDQILAWGAALSSVGIDAEAGGTAISRVFVDIANAVANGGDQLDQFAQVAGMSTSAFARAFQQDASAAVVTFVEGLGRLSDEGANVFGILDDLSLGNIRVRDALLRASGAGDLLRQSLDLSAEAWEENLALTREAELRYGTSESRLAMLRNQFQVVAITLGDALVPVMLGLVDAVSAVVPYIEIAARIFAELPGPVQLAAVAFAAVAAAAGPLLLVAGGMAAGFAALTPVVATATAALTSFNIAMLANPITAGLVVAGLAAGAVAAKIFGDAMGDANAEMERSLRIAEQTQAQTQEYIFDLQRREQAIRDEIAALQDREDEWILADGRLKHRNELLIGLRAELDGVTKELGAQEAALRQHQKQEEASARATEEAAAMMGELGAGAIGAANDLAKLTPQMVATGVAARVMRLWMSETLPPMTGMALGMNALVQGIRQVQEAAEMQAGLQGLTNAILGVAGVTDAYEQSARRATGATRGLSAAEREAKEATKEAEQAAKDAARAHEEAATKVVRVHEERKRAFEQFAQEVIRSSQAMRQEAARGIETLGRTLVTAIQRQHQQELDSRLAVLEAERVALEGAHDRRLRMLERERDAALDAVDAQIAALDRLDATDRLAELEAKLAIAWDPREAADIQKQITQFERDQERTRLQENRRAIEDRFSDRQRALEEDFRAQQAALDKQVASAKRAYEQATVAWKLEAQARELIANQEQEAITALIAAHVPEWVGQWQSFADGVIDGPLSDLRAEIASVLGMMGNAKLSVHRSKEGGLVGLIPAEAWSPPSFAVGGFVREPQLAVIGDRPGGEHVFGDDQLRRAIREEAGGSAPIVNISFANGMEWLRDFVTVTVDGRERRSASFGTLESGVRIR